MNKDMNKVKIRFKGGNTGHFYLADEDVESVTRTLTDSMRYGNYSILELTDIEDGKTTLIDTSTIATFGYDPINSLNAKFL